MTPQDKEEIKKQLVEEFTKPQGALTDIAARWKAEIREEIDKDRIKKEIVDELGKKPDGFLKHPATLLLFGFLLTTLFGTIITAWWKYSEWKNEQEYLKIQARCDRERLTRSEEIKQKYEVKDDIIKRVAETNTAAEEILLYFQMEPHRRKREQDERMRYWKDASRNWRISEKVLKQRLLLRFTNPTVSQLFDEITLYRGWVGININNQQEALSSRKPVCDQIVDQAYTCMGHITGDLMPQVIKIMNEEIWSDEKYLRAAECASTPSPAGTNQNSPLQTANAVTSQNQPAEVNACKKLQQIAGICDPKKKH